MGGPHGSGSESLGAPDVMPTALEASKAERALLRREAGLESEVAVAELLSIDGLVAEELNVDGLAVDRLMIGPLYHGSPSAGFADARVVKVLKEESKR